MSQTGKDSEQVRYLALIIDGNRRWAERRGLSVTDGHRAGAATVLERLRDAIGLGVEELVIYALSTENWGRPAAEVSGLLELISDHLDVVTPRLHEEGVRLRFLGERGGPVPAAMSEKMDRAEELTAGNSRMTFYIPFNYGGRAEIVRAARRFEGGGEVEFRRHLYAPDMHDPDLVIRTGGERRLSNYLLWQIAESELAFREEMWPDFSRRSLEEAIATYRQR